MAECMQPTASVDGSPLSMQFTERVANISFINPSFKIF